MDLAEIPLFAEVAEDEKRRMLECLNGTVRHYRKNQIIFLEGDPLDSVGIVLNGTVLVFQDNYDGERTILSAVEAPDSFCEEYVCAGIRTLPVSIAASEPSDILMIDSRKIASPCAKACLCHQQMIRNLLKTVARRNLRLNQKIELMSKKTTKEKIMAFLFSEAKKAGSNHFTISIDRQTLADYLGVERTAMSAEIGKLCREGRITANKKEFRILDAGGPPPKKTDFIPE